jgi:hypothetical protein
MSFDMSEKCVRCGEESEDLCILWMAYTYQMSELKIPFEEKSIFGHICQKMGEKEFFNHKVPVWDETELIPDFHHPFYTLRVCKDCRASWMQSIKDWFNR